MRPGRRSAPRVDARPAPGIGCRCEWRTVGRPKPRVRRYRPRTASSTGNDYFGESLAVSGDGSTALIGAPDENENGSAAGAAYVFERSDGSWSQQAKLLADDGDRTDQFGSSVGLSRDGSLDLIGASLESNRTGSAYVFE